MYWHKGGGKDAGLCRYCGRFNSVALRLVLGVSSKLQNQLEHATKTPNLQEMSQNYVQILQPPVVTIKDWTVFQVPCSPYVTYLYVRLLFYVRLFKTHTIRYVHYVLYSLLSCRLRLSLVT